MLVDEITISVMAGNGGKGAISFKNNMMALGPTGADGGKGGSVYLEGTSDFGALRQFKFKKRIEADDGLGGRSKFRDGNDGADLVLKVPVGTVFTKIETGETDEVTATNNRILIARGGRGGKGNFKFRSSLRTSPKIAQEGTLGEHFTLHFELKMIADIGLIGLPNAGKSSLLNELTRAGSKVGNYPFTTLEPNLGVYYDLVLADIPGLIEGASEGKGLGTKFLRHIERTKILFHLISAESEDVSRDYAIIKKELKHYKKVLAEKPEFLFLTKSDTMSPEECKKKAARLKKINKNVMAISIHDYDSVEKIKNLLNTIKLQK